MKLVVLVFLLTLSISSSMIFNFSSESDITRWRVVDDVVMGGKSLSRIEISPEGFGVFTGDVSLKNNGGFSSIRYQFEKMNINEKQNICIRLCGDGKKYQFRLKSNSSDYYSYIISFQTTGKWQEIMLPLKEMYPSFRGRTLDMANFSNDYIEQIGFLIANKKEESFRLIIDKIELK